MALFRSLRLQLRIGTMALAPIAVGFAAGCATPPAPPAVAPVEAAAADEAARHAAAMVGRPYRFGGRHPSTGFDCSGLVYYSYRSAGVQLPRTTQSLFASSRPVARKALRRGDLLFFDQQGQKRSHVGIYLGGGRFVHAPSSGKTVRTDRIDNPYWARNLSALRRF